MNYINIGIILSQSMTNEWKFLHVCANKNYIRYLYDR